MTKPATPNNAIETDAMRRGRWRAPLIANVWHHEHRTSAQHAPEYHPVMQVVTGTVVEGKVVLDGASLPEGAVVTVFAKDSEATVRLPPHLQVELEEALAEADVDEGISADELFEQLKKYG